jgi:hypothetical protein
MNTNTQHATPELFAALSKAQGEIENASKNAANPHFKSKYADLAEILNTTRPVFAAHGLSLSQFPGFDGSLASVTTVIAHSSGGYIVAVASCVPAKSDAQGIGSATTYLRRYSAAAAAGIAQEDDDGQSAAHNKKPGPIATKVSPMDGALDGFNPEQLAFLKDQAKSIVQAFSAHGPEYAASLFYRDLRLEQDEQMGVWALMADQSTIRNQIKKFKDSVTTTEKAA